MNYKEFEQKAFTTKAYAEEVAIPYVVLGLCGELGEIYEKMQQDASNEKIMDEVSDVMWYMASIRGELNLPIEENWNWTESYQEIDPFELPILCGRISEQVKKYLRDEWPSDFPEKRIVVITETWKNIWKALNSIANKLGYSLEEIAIHNNEKLASRKERNKIHGEGDVR